MKSYYLEQEVNPNTNGGYKKIYQLFVDNALKGRYFKLEELKIDAKRRYGITNIQKG